MKVVKLSHPNYEYDVHSLVKAFYAEDQVTVITPETKPEKLAELEPQVSLEIELAETGAKIRVGEEDFLWDAETENLADGYKNGLKRFLYRTLSKVTGQKLPWGNLTGIRPTKIAYGMLDEGRSDAEILEFMEQSHYVSEEKALLGIDIAKRERDLLKRFITKVVTACTLGFRSALQPVSIVPLPLIRSLHSAGRWTPMWTL